MNTSQYYFEKLSKNLTQPLRTFSTTSPRKLLFGVNFVLIICAVCVTLYSLALTSLLYEPDFLTGWIYWLLFSIVGFCMFVIAIVGMRGAHLVSLDIILTYFWLVIVLIVPLLLSQFAVFNISFYTRIYLKHQWERSGFETLREIFCDPSSTAGNKCIAPLVGGDVIREFETANDTFETTLDWCESLFNATDCEDIRNNAISEAVDWGTSLIIAESAIGVLGLFLMSVAIYTSVQILTAPVITQSMLDVINYLLILPIAACAAQTWGFWWIQTLEDLEYTWLPRLYLALAVSQVAILPLGIVGGRKKSRILLTGYIGTVIIIACALAVAGSIGWALAKITVEDWNPSDNVIGGVACRKNLPGCSGCDQNDKRCPEWTDEEIVTLLSLDFRLTGMVSSLSILYHIGALIVAFLVENSLKNYKSDFI